MDPDSSWMLDDDTPTDTFGQTEVALASRATPASASAAAAAPFIPTGPPVPNPYAHVLDVPKLRGKEYTHWSRNKHLQYKYITEYANAYYDDYVNYLEKRQRGIYRDVPRPQEWPERALRLYAKEGERLTHDSQYWLTDKNKVKDRSSIFHAVHSKDYYRRQYKILT